MTRALLLLLGRVRGPWWAMLLLALVVLALLPATLLLDAVALFVRTARVEAVLARSELICPRGHRVVVHGDALWICGGCGFSYQGAGLAPCPRCGAVAGYVVCPCGLAIQNPLFDLLEGGR